MGKNKTTLNDINKTAQTASSILKLMYDEKKNNTSVSIPKLYSREYRLTINQAFEVLNNYGLKAVAVTTQLQEADIKFKDCFDNQVISTDPKAGQKVKPGDTVLVKYITQAVIDESQRIFDEKKQAEINKSIKRIEQKEKREQLVSEFINTSKSSVKKIADAVQKKGKEKSPPNDVIVVEAVEICQNDD